jgi:alpha-tubulin suppressor-like RCC1 family protein
VGRYGDTVAEYGEHACALLADGTVVCWGANAAGQLGNGQRDPDPLDFDYYQQNNPVQVVCDSTSAPGCANTALGSVVALAAGSAHTCALLASGHVKCWGGNWANQLGDGTSDTQDNPVDVLVAAGNNLLDDAVAITAGFAHTCAIRRDTTVACWGYNEDGELGTGSWGGGAVYPATVCASGTGLGCVPLRDVVAISAGTWNTCALLGDGTVRCWGWAHVGQLGSGENGVPAVGLWGYAQLNPVSVCAPRADDSCDPARPCTEHLTGIVAVDVGWRHTCAVAEGGEVYCWGVDNYWTNYGQRGNGDIPRASGFCTPSLVCNIGAGSCGGSHTYANANLMTCDSAVVSVP